MNHKVIKNYSFNLIYQIINVVVQIITLPYLARVIGTEGIGIYSYTNAIVSIFMIIGALGINWYGQREIANNIGDDLKSSQIFCELSVLKIVCFIVIVPIYFFISISILGNRYLLYMIAQSILYFGTMLDISWYYQGIENFGIVAIRNSFIKCLGIILVFIFVRDEKDTIIYILIIGISTLVANMALWMSISQNVKRVSLSTLDFKQHIKPVLYYAIPTLASSVYLLLDKAMIGIITQNDVQNGNYEQATQVYNLLKTIIISYNSIMISRMTAIYAEGKEREAQTQMRKSFSFISLIMCPLAVGTLFVAKDFVSIYYGPNNDNISVILCAFCPAIIFVGISNTLEAHVITPLKKRKQGNIAVITGAVINFTANIILIPRFEAVGAAIASSLSEGIIAIMYIVYSKKYIDNVSIFQNMFKKVIAVAAMALVLFNIPLHGLNCLVRIIIQVILGSLVYFGVLFLIDKNEFIEKDGRKL